MSKGNFWMDKIVLPAVKKALETLKVNQEIKDLIAVSEASNAKYISDVKSDLLEVLKSEINELNQTSDSDLQATKEELNTKIDKNVMKLGDKLSNNTAEIKEILDILEKYVSHVKKIDDSLQSAMNQLSIISNRFDDVAGSVELTKTEFKASLNKSKTDIAKLFENTRTKILDVDEKLDAFIETISEKLARIRKN